MIRIVQLAAALLVTLVSGELVSVPASPGATPLESGPILIRHDRHDSVYVALGRRFADVLAHVEERAEGIVLAPRWVLTAAHVAVPIGPFDHPYVMVGGERYGLEKIIIHPEWEGGWENIFANHDLALLKLDRPVPRVRPLHLYRGNDESGMMVTLVGRGRTGTGITGPVGEKGTVVRGATNQVDGVSPTTLILTFDSGAGATELEGLSGAGDSGNPLLFERNDSLYLVGVGSAGTGSEGHGWYGNIDIFVRVSSFADWIERTIATDPRPTADWSTPIELDPETPRWPETPAGTMARDFFTAYEASRRDESSAELAAFYEVNGARDPDRSPEDRAAAIREGLVNRLGALDIQGYSTAGPNQIMVLVYSPEQDAWRSIGLNTTPDAPYRLDRLYMKFESPDDKLREPVGRRP